MAIVLQHPWLGEAQLGGLYFLLGHNGTLGGCTEVTCVIGVIRCRLFITLRGGSSDIMVGTCVSMPTLRECVQVSCIVANVRRVVCGKAFVEVS